MQVHALPPHVVRARLLRYVLGRASSLGANMKPCLSNVGRYVRINAPASPHLHGQIGRISGRRPEHYEVSTPLGFRSVRGARAATCEASNYLGRRKRRDAMSAHDDEAERAAADGGPRAYKYELDFLVYRERAAQGRFGVPVLSYGRGSDELGHETDDMLRERIMRSAFELGDGYKGQRLPYVPRQGPVRLTDAQVREQQFEHELEALQEKYWVDLAGDYWVNARPCCNCGEPAERGRKRCLKCQVEFDSELEPR